MKAWIIRHKPSGAFMPCRMSRNGFGGWSHWEPVPLTEYDKPFDANPRIFWTERAAINALSMWLQGRWVRETHTESEGWEYPSYTVTETVLEAPKVPRVRADMEVIPIIVSLPIDNARCKFASGGARCVSHCGDPVCRGDAS